MPGHADERIKRVKASRELVKAYALIIPKSSFPKFRLVFVAAKFFVDE
jgi:hypothetical protein